MLLSEEEIKCKYMYVLNLITPKILNEINK